MERPGVVTRTAQDRVEVTFCRPEACQKCGGCEGSRHETVLWVPGEAKVGDTVMVEMRDSTVAAASLLAYALPLAGLIGGMVLGGLLFPVSKTVAGALGAVVGLAATVTPVVMSEKKRRKDPKWQPRITRVWPAGSDEAPRTDE